MNIDNTQDIIDSREVIDRIEELRADLEGFEDKSGMEYDDEIEELRILEELNEEGEACAPDWIYGEYMIRESYFKDYAMDLADDLGLMENCNQWPATCIDWDRAADELKMDYSEIEFDGVTYYVRS